MSPELRIDPLSGLRVIVAGERGSRPGAWLDVPPRPPIDRERDPFAAGHEDRTPPELFTLPGADGEREFVHFGGYASEAKLAEDIDRYAR